MTIVISEAVAIVPMLRVVRVVAWVALLAKVMMVPGLKLVLGRRTIDES